MNEYEDLYEKNKVLSIDMDFFLKDCVHYQKYQDDELTPEQNWELVKWKYKNPFDFDDLAFSWIKDFLKESCKNAKEFVLITEHDEIINHLERWNIQYAHITNIDNHHDITYHTPDTELNIGNWVVHGFNDDLIGSYHWVHQDLSESCLVSPVEYTHSSWKTFMGEPKEEYDYVVICLSKYFTPIEYWNRRDILSSFLEEMGIPKYDEVESNAIVLPKDYFNKDLFIVSSERIEFRKERFTLGYDIINNGEYWFTVERLDNEEEDYPRPMDMMVKSRKFVEEILEDGKVCVFAHRINYRSDKIIKMFIRHFCKKYKIEFYITNQNIYYKIIPNK